MMIIFNFFYRITILILHVPKESKCSTFQLAPMCISQHQK